MKNDIIRTRLGSHIVDVEKFNMNHTGEIVMMEQDGHHTYSDNGTDWYISVTTVLKYVSHNEYITKWANGLGFRHIKYMDELKKSADIGNAVHHFAQNLVDPEYAEPFEIDDPLIAYYMRRRGNTLKERLELEEYPWKTILTEAPFISKQQEIGGTLDWYADFRGKLTIGDFKSASGMREKFLYQLGGYSILCDDNGIEWEQGMIVLCKEDNCLIYVYPKEIILDFAKAFNQIQEYSISALHATSVIKDQQFLTT